MLFHQKPALLRDGIQGVIVHFTPCQNGELGIQELHELPVDPALRLAAEAQEDEVVPGEDGVHQLRNHRLVITHDAGEQASATLKPPGKVLSKLVFHRQGPEVGGLEFTECRRSGSGHLGKTLLMADLPLDDAERADSAGFG